MISNHIQVPFLDLKKINLQYAAQFDETLGSVLDAGWFIMGQKLKTFEKEYADYCGSKHCIGVANGLDALILIFKAYKELGYMKDGDEIIVPANTYIASLLAISANQLIPVLVEPDLATYTLDEALIEEKITEKTKGILAVSLYGQTPNFTVINQIAEKYSLKVVEDAAQSHGARHFDKVSGSLANATGHSFYPGKNLGALGDGGAITTDDDVLADVLVALRNYGSHKKYENLYKSVNSRLDELQAAFLSVKLKDLDNANDIRRKIAYQYLNGITNPAILLPFEAKNNKHVWHVFVVRTANRERFQQYLSDYGIQTVIHYPIPPHKQKAYKELASLSFPITEKIHQEVISLPMSPVMPPNHIEYLIEVVNNYSI
jgi:dTDP-4-amino-4,6-dideoxygalactose transaminase